MRRRPLLLAVGGAHVDRRGRVAGAYVAGASNPGTMREEVGGSAFNALRAAVQRGVDGALLSLRGGDAAGAAVAEAVAEAGIADLSVTFLDRPSPSYTALLDGDGELIAGLADMGLYELGFARQLARRKAREAIAAADGVLCDANLPAEAIARLAAMAAGKPLFSVAVSPAKAARLADILPRLSCLFMTGREARALAGGETEDRMALVTALRRRGLRSGVVTAGPQPVLAFNESGVIEVAMRRPVEVVDVTGAGDALAGTAAAALLRGADFREAVREGMAAARAAVGGTTAAPTLAAESFEAALALVAEPRAVA